MTLLKVHDFQQELATKFIQKAKAMMQLNKSETEKMQLIYFEGQELGFCNDEIDILLEELI